MNHEYLAAPAKSPQRTTVSRAPPRISPARVHQLAGNRAFGRLQAKLTINQPGDAFEQEADRVADQIMRMPEPHLQRECACGGTCDDCKTDNDAHVQRATTPSSVPALGDGHAPPSVEATLRSPGEPLDGSTRGFMESRFGRDFRAVRLHSDGQALASARDVSARAYTVGNHVVLGEHHMQPGTEDGRRLLAHELTHVLQQGGAEADEMT